MRRERRDAAGYGGGMMRKEFARKVKAAAVEAELTREVEG